MRRIVESRHLRPFDALKKRTAFVLRVVCHHSISYSSLDKMVKTVRKKLGAAAKSIGVTFPPKVLGTVSAALFVP